MTILSDEEFMALKTREGLENWLQPGVRVKCVNPTAVQESFDRLVQGRAPTPDLTQPHTIEWVGPSERNPNWTRFKLVGFPSLKFAPEDAKGISTWEPVD
jgi:hypothetical protein